MGKNKKLFVCGVMMASFFLMGIALRKGIGVTVWKSDPPSTASTTESLIVNPPEDIKALTRQGMRKMLEGLGIVVPAIVQGDLTTVQREASARGMRFMGEGLMPIAQWFAEQGRASDWDCHTMHTQWDRIASMASEGASPVELAQEIQVLVKECNGCHVRVAFQ
jgi:hypothetical protein